MARRNKSIDPGWLVILLILGALGALFDWMKKNPIPAAITIGSLLIISIFIFVMKQRENKRRKEELNENIRIFLADVFSVISQHAEALSRKRRQLVTKDAYGNEVTKKWDGEKLYFMSTVISPRFRDKSPIEFTSLSQLIFDEIENISLLESKSLLTNKNSLTTKDIGDDLEIQCEDALNSAGWNVRRVGGSGDQGIDIIAEKNQSAYPFNAKITRHPLVILLSKKLALGNYLKKQILQWL